MCSSTRALSWQCIRLKKRTQLFFLSCHRSPSKYIIVCFYQHWYKTIPRRSDSLQNRSFILKAVPEMMALTAAVFPAACCGCRAVLCVWWGACSNISLVAELSWAERGEHKTESRESRNGALCLTKWSFALSAMTWCTLGQLQCRREPLWVTLLTDIHVQTGRTDWLTGRCLPLTAASPLTTCGSLFHGLPAGLDRRLLERRGGKKSSCAGCSNF